MRFILALLVLLASTGAAAQQPGLGLYLGLGVGNFRFEEDQGPLSVAVDRSLADRVAGELAGSVGTTAARLDDSELAWKLFGGWDLSRHLGVEISYGRTNELTSVYTEQVGDVTVSANLSATLDIQTARVMGYLPVRVGAVYGGLGYFSAESQSTQNIGLVLAGIDGAQAPVRLGGSSTESGPTASLGFRFPLLRFSLRAEFEWLQMSAADAATLSVGASMRF